MRSGVSVNYSYKFFWGALLGGCAWSCVAQVEIDQAWVQLAPPGAAVNAAYMRIYNPQSRPQTIVGVSADCCAMAMLHQTRIQGDKMTMEHLDLLVVPAQANVELAPGGLHIMLMQAEQELTIGNEIKITFSLGDGTTQDVNIQVKKNAP